MQTEKRKINPRSLANLKRDAGPGRPKGSLSGRSKVLQTLDSILAEHKTKEKIIKFYLSKLDDDPGSFLKDHVYPFIPKDVNLNLPDTDITVVIRHRAQQLAEEIREDVKIDVSQLK